MQKIKRREIIEIELEDIKTKDGDLLKNLTKKELAEILKDGIASKTSTLKLEGKTKDSKHEFKSFRIDKKLLTKYSESDEVYPHFVYWYLRNWHVNSYDSRHFTNGGNWQHGSYNPNNKWDALMIKNMKNKKRSNVHHLASIRDMILIHFYTGDVIRMYGTGMYYKTIRNFKSVEERKAFFDFILDSGMVSINKKEELRSLTRKVDKYDMLNGSSYNTIGESFLHHCIRHSDMETLKYLVEKKGLDLYEIDKKPFECWSNDAKTEVYHGHGTSFLCRLIDDICSSNYEYYFQEAADPNHWPNGRLVDKSERAERNKDIKESKPTIDFFRQMFAYINKKFPNLKVYAFKGGVKAKDNIRVTFDKSTAVHDVMTKHTFHNNNYNKIQIKYVQKLFFGN